MQPLPEAFRTTLTGFPCSTFHGCLGGGPLSKTHDETGGFLRGSDTFTAFHSSHSTIDILTFTLVRSCIYSCHVFQLLFLELGITRHKNAKGTRVLTDRLSGINNISTFILATLSINALNFHYGVLFICMKEHKRTWLCVVIIILWVLFCRTITNPLIISLDCFGLHYSVVSMVSG